MSEIDIWNSILLEFYFNIPKGKSEQMNITSQSRRDVFCHYTLPAQVKESENHLSWFLFWLRFFSEAQLKRHNCYDTEGWIESERRRSRQRSSSIIISFSTEIESEPRRKIFSIKWKSLLGNNPQTTLYSYLGEESRTSQLRRRGQIKCYVMILSIWNQT